MQDAPSILVITDLGDPHSRAVIWALRQAGCEPTILGLGHFPAEVTSSISVHRNSDADDRQDFNDQPFARPFDAAWYRRQPVVVPSPELASADIKFVRQETERYVYSAIASVEAKLWVNEPEAARRADDKVHQLRVARSLGFRIPDTLVSNSPDAVRRFRERHTSGIIYKSFCPMSWQNEDGHVSHTQTQLLPAGSNLDHESIILCPGIYQEAIPKKHELRVTVFGNEVHSLLIESQRDKATHDWRIDVTLGNISCRLHQIDPDTADRCRRLCSRLNLAFGAIDLIVTESGEVVFIEVNEAGNFLFYDDVDPSCGMLQSFCAFLVGNSRKAGDFPGYRDYMRDPDYRSKPKPLEEQQKDDRLLPLAFE